MPHSAVVSLDGGIEAISQRSATPNIKPTSSDAAYTPWCSQQPTYITLAHFHPAKQREDYFAYRGFCSTFNITQHTFCLISTSNKSFQQRKPWGLGFYEPCSLRIQSESHWVTKNTICDPKYSESKKYMTPVIQCRLNISVCLTGWMFTHEPKSPDQCQPMWHSVAITSQSNMYELTFGQLKLWKRSWKNIVQYVLRQHLENY